VLSLDSPHNIGTVIWYVVIWLVIPALLIWLIVDAVISMAIKEISQNFGYSIFNADRASFRKMLVDHFETSFPNAYKARYSDDTNLLFKYGIGQQIRVRLFPDRAQVVGLKRLVDELWDRLKVRASQDFEKQLGNEFGIITDRDTTKFIGKAMPDDMAREMSTASVEWTCQTLKGMASKMHFDQICITTTNRPMIICNTKPPMAFITDLDANKLVSIMKGISTRPAKLYRSVYIIYMT
jgi:hypothetical protein